MRAEGDRHNAALICRRCDVSLAMLRDRRPYQPAARTPPKQPGDWLDHDDADPR
jgi:hypothetical protein